jgi:hypothetical protein
VLVPVYAALAAALAFFLIIPVIGAAGLRSQWRKFRDRVIELALSPVLGYADVAKAAGGGGGRGSFRLYGSVEAIEGADRVWIRGDGVSALVDLSRAPAYTVPPGEPEAGTVRRLRWRSVSSVVEGTRMFVGGKLVAESGKPVFVDDPDERLIAVIHDGDDEGLAARLIVGGRSLNEYFSYATPLSLALGLIAVIVVLFVTMGSPFSSVRALVFLIGALPALPFAPPGLLLFLAYRRLWRRALDLRIERDALRLSLPGAALPTGLAAAAGGGGASAAARRSAEAYRKALACIAAAVLCFALSVALNYVLAFLVWRATL